MPDITFTEQERQRVDDIIDELDPADHELLCPYHEVLSADDWQFVCDYVRAKMRAVLETGLLVASVAERARITDLVGEDSIRNNFVRTLWNYDFSFRKAIEDTFVAVAGDRSEAPLVSRGRGSRGACRGSHVRHVRGRARAPARRCRDLGPSPLGPVMGSPPR